MLAKVGLGLLGTAVLAGAYLAQQGMVRVSVDEQGGQGTHLHLVAPAALVSLGLRVVPDEKLRDLAGQARPWLPAVRVVSAELARLPDADLLELRDAEQHVHIVKRGGALLLDVESPRHSVHVSFPLRLVHCVASRLESFVPTS
jgi:hypothetical protein